MSRIPWNKGIKTGIVPKTAFKQGCMPSAETIEKRRVKRAGYRHSEETKLKMSKSHIGVVAMSGETHYKWIKDRSLLSKKQERNDSSYKEWRINVYKRDGFKCKISNGDCCGRIEAHHILGWTEFPELRYVVSNGITLCHKHHPRKKADEKVLSPYFQSLLNLTN